MNKGTKRIALGTLIAGVVGYIAGILTAPKSGADTRDQIRGARDTGVAEAEKQLKKLHTELNNLLEEAGDKGRHAVDSLKDLKDKDGRDALEAEIVERASVVRQKTREIISALHDGGHADDRDLNKAISEASKAIKSIRKYLQK